jgi:1,2-diacylglycerol 3-alpha-glucosyltransferase
MKTTRLMFLVRRVGPYHDARFEAAGRELDLLVIETRPGSTEYPWTTDAGARGYRMDCLRRAPDPETGLRGAELESEIVRVLHTHRPEVVATAGWADPEYHVLLRHCHTLGIPAVVMSDSTRQDEPRHWWKEWIKGSLIRNYAAAVVAGSRSRDYLQRLGFAPHAIFDPWDVVDNGYFAATTDALRLQTGKNGAAARRFLCVARFIPKKNLEHLLSSYAAYAAKSGAEAWSLVLSGSGPLEAPLRAQVVAAGLKDRVEFAGFRQYPDLPECYARADALVLPSWSDQWGLVVNEAMAAGLPVLVSSHCGCAPDLLQDGANGYAFDPHHPHALKDCLVKMAKLSVAERQAMGAVSREIIASYSPESFAQGLRKAAACALAAGESQAPQFGRMLVRLLAARRKNAS